ncbi:hypothetical protein Pmani_028979 [Petrolisthes manimaculis]|uniref:Uncharacterized protein n=1 Tax=Petrolisthes manimaculis TaxID=1843537 RepID=A0AAE1P0X8_9EUCA|nr:hypothetical protein Pmani_028979 [Petrolisthes manimaculis]
MVDNNGPEGQAASFLSPQEGLSWGLSGEKEEEQEAGREEGQALGGKRTEKLETREKVFVDEVERVSWRRKERAKMKEKREMRVTEKGKVKEVKSEVKSLDPVDTHNNTSYLSTQLPVLPLTLTQDVLLIRHFIMSSKFNNLQSNTEKERKTA